MEKGEWEEQRLVAGCTVRTGREGQCEKTRASHSIDRDANLFCRMGCLLTSASAVRGQLERSHAAMRVPIMRAGVGR